MALTIAVDLKGSLVVVVGGGRVAEHKVTVSLQAGAQVRVVSPVITPGLEALKQQGLIAVVERQYAPGDTAGAMLVVAATGHPPVDAAVAAEAKAANRLVNVTGAPELGNVSFTAEVRHGPLSIAVSTAGASPALARRVRQAVGRVVGPEYGALAELLAEVREQVKAVPHLTQADRAALFERLVDGPALEMLARGETVAARSLVEGVVRAAIVRETE